MYNPKHIFASLLKILRRNLWIPKPSIQFDIKETLPLWPWPTTVKIFNQEWAKKRTWRSDLALGLHARNSFQRKRITEETIAEKRANQERGWAVHLGWRQRERGRQIYRYVVRGVKGESPQPAGANVNRGRAPWPGRIDRGRGHRESCLVLGEERNGLIGFLGLSWVGSNYKQSGPTP